MKTTGIVRKIDELGRIVIPKEIRQTLRIHSGDNVEMYMDEERLILQKVQPIDNFYDVASKYGETVYNKIHCGCLICSHDSILFSTDQQLNGRRINNKFLEVIKKGVPTVLKLSSIGEILQNSESYTKHSAEQYMAPIAGSGENFGAIVVFSLGDQVIKAEDKTFVMCAAELLCGQLI